MVYCIDTSTIKPVKNQRQENVPTHIFTPRTYQVEILDTAMQKSTIVCLATDTGKSFISIMLIRELAYLVRPRLDQGGKRTIVLINEASLVEQHAKVIRMYTDLIVGEYWEQEKMNKKPAIWWQKQFRYKQVLVMLGDIFSNVLDQDYFSVSLTNLIVFEECHRAVDDHPYVKVMEWYQKCPTKDRPRILGLTSSILAGQCTTPEALEESLYNLERVLDSTAETATDMVVGDLYGAKPTEVVVQCEPYKDQTGLSEQLEDILESAVIFLQDCNVSYSEEEGEHDPRFIPRTVLQECYEILKLLGPWCCGRVAQAFIKQISKLEENEVLVPHEQFLQMCHTQLRLVSTMVERIYEKEVQTLEDFLTYMSPKVIKLIEILRVYKPDDNFMIIGGDDFDDADSLAESDDSMDLSDDEEFSTKGEKEKTKHSSGGNKDVHYVAVKCVPTDGAKANKEDESLCGLVFVERGHVAFGLNKLIQELCNWDPDLFFIQSSHITGNASEHPGTRSREADIMNRKQEEILRKFRNKEFNLLVSTNVLEEGVDVPRCNLVVRFDLPMGYRSYVQSKGCARANKAKFCMLVDNEIHPTFHEDLKIFKGIESILMNRCHNREDLNEQEVDMDYADTLLPVYYTTDKEDSAKVTMSSAIGLVNKYCAKLPSDAFTHLTPKCTTSVVILEDGSQQFASTLQLPINSPIKEPIQGDPMVSKKLAKMAVALKTCMILHTTGELDDRLLPVGKEVIKYEDEEGEWEEHEAQGQARPGTTKRKQYYNKKIAQALLGHPKADKPCFMYILNMELTCPITEEQNTRGRKIHAPEETPRCFGLLCAKRMPLVPQFPVFTRSGEVTVSIDLHDTSQVFSAKELERLSGFHHTVFSKVLRLEKDPMMFNPQKADSSYILIPFYKGPGDELSIDWDFVNHVETTPITSRRAQLYDDKKDKFEFTPDLFDDAVVMPSYRNIDQPQYFYVAEIRHDLSPRSPFPSPELYDTFEHYYSSKYGLLITNPSQPLLDVDHTSARLNLLTPRYMNQKGVALPTSSAETRRARRENLQQKQILVPELCDVHPFPASLWRKAVCLPAMLYRMNCLLIAEEIREMIAKEAHIGVIRLGEDVRFPQLEFGFSTKPIDAKVKEKDVKDSPKSSESDKIKHAEKNLTLMEKHQEILKEKRQAVEKKESFAKKETNIEKEVFTSVTIEDLGSDEEKDIQKDNWKQENLPASETKWEIDMNSLAQDKLMTGFNHIMDLAGADRGPKITELSKEEEIKLKEELNREQTTQQELEDLSVEDLSDFEDDFEREILATFVEGENEVNKDDIKIEFLHVKNLEELRNTDGGIESASSFHTAAEFLTPESSPYKTKFSTPTLCDLENAMNRLNLGETDGEILAVTTLDTTEDGNETDTMCRGCDLPTAQTELEVKEQSVKNVQNKSPTSESLGTNELVTTESTSDLQTGACDCDMDIETPTEPKSTSKPCDTDGARDTSLKTSTYHQSESESSMDREAREKVEVAGVTNDDCICGQEVHGACSECSTGEKKHKSKGKKKNELNHTTFVRFDEEADLDIFVGPSPCTILQTLTMSNANDFFNLERLETIGDSFLKFAITVYLYCSYPGIHEGKLSYLRSKQVSNYNLYKLGKKKLFPECMVAAKFEPTENWLPPGFIIKKSNAYKGLSVFMASTAHSASRSNNAGAKINGTTDVKAETKLEQVKNEVKESVVNENSVSNGSNVKEKEKHEDLKDVVSLEKIVKEPIKEEKQMINDSLENHMISVREETYFKQIKAEKRCSENTLTELVVKTEQEEQIKAEKRCSENTLTELVVKTEQEEQIKEKRCSENTLMELVVKTEQEDLPETLKDEVQENCENYIQLTQAITDEGEDEPKKEENTSEELAEGEKTEVELVLDEQEAKFAQELERALEGFVEETEAAEEQEESLQCLIPYNLQTQHSLPDKSIADCVEALIGCYLTTCGQRAALQFMSWLGLKVLPETELPEKSLCPSLPSTPRKHQVGAFGHLEPPPSPLLTHVSKAALILEHHLDGYYAFEEKIQYKFRDRSYLLQAFTHASYHYNTVTDCYQRLEFLGDAILDYVITRHLFEDSQKHSPGILTDLRSALVNNNIFAALAVKWDFHKYFKAVSPQLFNVIEKFVTWQKDKNDEINLDEEFGEAEEEGNVGEGEDIEIPKALGDIFESVAGAIYLDSGMSLDSVWAVYYRMMKPQIDAFTAKIPKSPVRELLEMEPETAKFEKPERTMDGKIRVSVNVVGKGRFRGIGRNYRIAKSAAARRALKFIRMLQAHIEAGGQVNNMLENVGQYGDAMPIINMDPFGLNSI